MSDFDVQQETWDQFAERIRADEENKRLADLTAEKARFTPKSDLGKISGLPSDPLDPSTSSLEYEQGAYKYDGHYGQPVSDSEGNLLGYEFIQHDVAPGMMSIIRSDAQGNVVDSYRQQEGEGQDILGTVLQFAPILLMAVPGAGLALGQSILGAGASQATATAIGNAIINGAISEGRGGNFLEGAALSYAGSAIPGLDAVKEGSSYLSGIDPSGTLSKAFTSAITSGGKALLTGQDIGDAMLSGAASGGISGATSALTSNIEGFSDLTPAQQRTINNAISGVISGRPLDQVAINAAISTAKNEIQSLTSGGPSSSDFEEGSFAYGQVFDPKSAGMVDMSEQPLDEDYQFTTDFDVGADYSLGPKTDGLGFQNAELPEAFNDDGSVNYDLFDYDQLPDVGLDMPKSPNIDSMGGGQGLRVPVDGGYITEQGFIPDGYTADLGDPNSFINQPAPGKDVSSSVQKALDAGAKATAADINAGGGTGTSTTPKTQTSQTGVDLNALMALLGGGQSAPTVVSSGQDNSADIELMQNIFGTDLSALLAGNTDTQPGKLTRPLRS